MKKRICIIQLTRMGDLLQTLKAIEPLDRENIEFTLVARKTFAQPILFLLEKKFKDVYLFDTEEIYGQKDLEEADKALQSFIDQINQNEHEIVVNLTFSESSGYLATLINSKNKFGLNISKDRKRNITDKWSQYLYSTALTGPHNPFNFVDIFKMIIGVPTEMNNAIEPTTRKKQIVIHPFASRTRKYWKPTKWIEFIKHFHAQNKDSKIIIVGSKEEKELADVIYESPVLLKYRNRIENLCGETNLEEVYNLVKEAELFVGHDSMVGHLASLHSTPSVTISLGTVRPKETFPYTHNALVLSPKRDCFPCTSQTVCDNNICHSDISPKVSALLTHRYLKNSQAEEFDYDDLNKVIHENSFLSNSMDICLALGDSSGLCRLENLALKKFSLKESIDLIYRISWLYILEEKEENIQLPQITTDTQKELATYVQGVSQVYELAEFGKKFSKYILEELATDNPDTDKLKSYSAKLDEIDKLTNALIKPYPLLSPLVNFYSLSKANTLGEDLVRITMNTFFLYNDCSLMCSVFFDLANKILGTIEEKSNQSDVPMEN
ncbi:MAG: glycosyltransferase family 9 protein [Bacteriovoracaceae bacterium]